MDINELVERQRTFFMSGATLDADYRINVLKLLKNAVREMEGEIVDALNKDLGKSGFESYMCEIGMTLSELSYMIRHTRGFMRDRTVMTPLAQFAARSYVKKTPHGTVLIMSPWNYPFMLTMEPLVDALAAGNTAILKPSNYSPHTAQVIKKLIERTFAPEYVAVVTGGRDENQQLLDQKFDYIFFTGSMGVGRLVMSKAAEHLTPVTLELGGKSPCIVDATADIPLAARRIVFGKYLNCGQTCVAPDYVLCDESVKDALVAAVKKEIVRQFGEKPLENPDYGKIVNEKHFERISGLIDRDKVVIGGESDAAALRIEPTVMDNVSFGDAVMREEIFGPVMPILTFKTLDGAVRAIGERPHPLALYMFSTDRDSISFVTSRCRFGGGCVNDTIIHLATSSMGFGGAGDSGMGSYHGKKGFDAFSHDKSIVDKKNWLDLPMRYQPYTKNNEKAIRMFLR